jgi:hypothetical protein
VLDDHWAAQVAAVHAMAGDRDGLRELGGTLRARLRGESSLLVREIEAQLDPVFEAAFPTEEPSGYHVEHVADLLDAPWGTAARHRALKQVDAIAGGHAYSRSLEDLARVVLGGPRGAARTRAIRGLLFVEAESRMTTPVVALLGALHAEGGLTRDDVARALLTNPHIGGDTAPGPVAELIRGYADDILWAATDPACASWSRDLPRHVPAGARFVLRGLDMLAGRHPVDRTWYEPASELPTRLCRARLTGAELAALAPTLAAMGEADRHRAFAHRYAVGDAEGLLPAYGLQEAAPVLALVRANTPRSGPGAPPPPRCDVAAVRAVIDATDAEQVRSILVALPDNPAAELFAALYGWNREIVLRRFKKHAYGGIAAFGLLPPDGDSLLDRYLALRASARHGATFGAERRVKHAAVIEVALDHLAQVNGYPDASGLELDMEARIAGEFAAGWDADDYRITLDVDSTDLVIARGGKTLAGVPAAIRRTDAYQAARAAQETLREQRRRIRHGLIERLVATGDPMDADKLARYLAVPAAAGPLRALIWRDDAGTTGLLAAADQLVDLTGEIQAVRGPLHAIHPVELDPDDLAAWQREIVRRRVVQPVKQAFREVYVPTPAEVTAGVESARFAGHAVSGTVAARLLSGRGWRVDGGHRELLKRHGTVEAGVYADVDHYFAEPGAHVVLGTAAFTDRGATIRLVDVPARAFSETMRDLDLVVGVAGQGRTGSGTEIGLAERAALLAALVADLGLDRVAVDGHHAVVGGERATYRVHLGSGSIHVEPGGYLCVVPEGFGAKPARGLFLPFADADQLTSVILSKVLLLANDSKITDSTILAQLARMARQP